jgi:hypothetical protein
MNMRCLRRSQSSGHEKLGKPLTSMSLTGSAQAACAPSTVRYVTNANPLQENTGYSKHCSKVIGWLTKGNPIGKQELNSDRASVCALHEWKENYCEFNF